LIAKGQLSLPLRDRWKIFVAMDRLLIATAEQKEGERYGGERYGDQRSEGGFGCHHDLRLSALIANALHRIEVPAERGMEGEVLILAAVPTSCRGGRRIFLTISNAYDRLRQAAVTLHPNSSAIHKLAGRLPIFIGPAG
jgi:hypothetical protein